MFSNTDTAGQYEPVPGFEADRQVTLVGHFSKPVSLLTPDEAQQLIDNGVNYIRTKSGPPAPVAAAPEAMAATADITTEAAPEAPEFVAEPKED